MIDHYGAKPWKINIEERAIYLYTEGSSSVTSMPVYIPALTPTKSQNILISRGPSQISYAISTTGIINDPKCRITSKPSVMLQNYKTVTRRENQEFQKPILRRGDELVVEIPNENIDEIFLTTKKDPSTMLPK